ncbi:4-alpha-glucanotransferase [Amaricoccus macauensis]|uniref:4-alpha-glucanotransferase n=1 Tax=Amaricoccus macauensis TaxID=57001 RepID=UPI003C7EA8EF
MSKIADLARRYAIADTYEDVDGVERTAPDTTLEALLSAFGVDTSDPEAALAAAPPADAAPELAAPPGTHCHLPDALHGNGRLWGIALQLYQLRSDRNWGIGDFNDLAEFAKIAGAAGADFVGLNPLHALFLANPAHCSPFSPSNRRFLNPLYIAVDAVEGFKPGDCNAELLEEARGSDLVDYPTVAQIKKDALWRIWTRHGESHTEFHNFCNRSGEALRRHAVFEAISEQMTATGHGAGWLGWPEPWQDPESDTVRAFTEDMHHKITFHTWLQFLADRQLAAAREAAFKAGMRIGLYLDFAVGEAPDGSSTWSDNSLVLGGVRVGAPPDAFNDAGQDWGLAPLSPISLAEQKAAPFHDLMADATRRAGALRIDHAMGLWQLFLIPEGTDTANGTYARYPIGDMLTALAQASRENGCIMIGEDLGNVPPGFREVMEAAAILSYRILLFERTEEGFIPPEEYPRTALVGISTHDLPTFQGWWRGDDASLAARIGLVSEDAAAERAQERGAERDQLLEALSDADLWSGASPASSEAPEALVVAVHRHLARAPSMLFAARLEDLAGETAPVNLPGTSDEYPNWRPRLGISIDALASSPLFRDITGALAAERPRKSE